MSDVTAYAQRLWERIADILANPTANLTGAAILLAAFVVLVLIVVLAMLAWLTGAPDEDEVPKVRARRSAPVPAAERRARSRVLAFAIVASATVLVLSVYSGLDEDRVCLACHDASSETVKTWTESGHAAVKCFDCHSSGGVLGGLAGRAQYVEWLDSTESSRTPFVPDDACAECHDEALDGTWEGVNVRMRHSDVIGVYECTACHSDAGHESDESRPTAVMQRCLLCHDGAQAPAECETCHITDVSRVSGTPPERFPKVEMGPPKDCRGCHDIASCTACHGLEMPHPDEFVNWAHAKDAAFGKKESCKRCHDYPEDCNKCHRFEEGGHTDNWRYEHARAEGNSQGCTGCHQKQTEREFCAVCHW